MAQYDLLLTQNVHATLTEYSEKFVNVAKGGLISADASQNPTVLVGGTDGFILSRDDAEDTGLKWIDPTSGQVSVANQGNDRILTATAVTDALNAEEFLTYNTTQGLLIGSGNGILFTAAAKTYQIYTPSSALKASISIVTGTNSAGGAGDVTLKAGAGTATGGNVYFQRDTTYGNFYFGTGAAGQLPAKTAETDVLYYDSTTGLVSYGAATSSPWTRTGTLISPTTASDDIRLSSNEHIQFEGSTNAIYGGINGSSFFIVYNTNVTMHFDNTQVLCYRDFKVATGNTKTYDLGASNAWWKDAYVDRLYIDDANTYIDIATGDMTFTDTNSGTVTLASLVSGGTTYWSRSGTDISPTTTGDDVLLNGGGFYISSSVYMFSSVGNYSLLQNSALAVQIESSNIYLHTRHVSSNTTDTYDLGGNSYFWRGTYSQVFYVDNNTTSIQKDVSDNLTFTDSVTGTKTLAELSGGTSVTIGNTGEVPFSNTGTPGTDFSYASSLTYTAGSTLNSTNGFASTSLGQGSNYAVLYASTTGVFGSSSNFTFATNVLSIGSSSATSEVHLGASGSTYDWELKHEDGNFKVDYFTGTYLEVTNTQTYMYGGAAYPVLTLQATSSIITGELGRFNSAVGQYYDGSTAITVDGALFRPSAAQTVDYTMLYQYSTTYGGMFHRNSSGASDLRMSNDDLEWGVTTPVTSWRGTFRVTANYIQVKGNSGSTTSLYLDGFGSTDDSMVWFREGTTTKAVIGWDGGNESLNIVHGSSSMTGSGRINFLHPYLIYFYGSTSAGLFLDAATTDARFYLNGATGYDGIIYFRENNVSQFVMGHDASSSLFQIHSGTAFTTAAAGDFSIDLNGYVYMGNLRSVNNTPALRYNTGTGEVTYYSSDARLKKNIRPFAPSGLETLMSFDPKTYEWDEFEGTNHGWIAQEGKDHIPSMFPLVEKTGMYMLSETEILPYMHKAIIELNDKIKDLTRQLEEK